jgi:hypothetical protein
VAIAIALGALLASCRQPAADPVDAAASPQASAEPAPIATTQPTTDAQVALDAGPPPAPMRADRPLDPDAPSERAKDPAKDGGREITSAKELSGWTLSAALRASDIPGPPKAPEVSDKGLEAARKKTEAHLAIDLSQTRARIVLAEGAFVLPQGAEIRARTDRYGHVLLLPNEATYRVVAPGALRALFGERRLDVAPLAPAELSAAGDGLRRFNLRTRKVDVTTRAAKATFEIASVAGAGEGGALVCRALLDLMNAPPQTPLCSQDDVPLHAELRWTTKGWIAFDVITMARRYDLAAQQLAAPPMNASFVRDPLPHADSEPLLTKSDLAALRTNAVDPPSAPQNTPQHMTERADAHAPAPQSGLSLSNGADVLLFVWIDGVPAAWIAPGAQAHLDGLQRGRYLVQWRTFLGDAWEPPHLVNVPGSSAIVAGDAGAN